MNAASYANPVEQALIDCDLSWLFGILADIHESEAVTLNLRATMLREKCQRWEGSVMAHVRNLKQQSHLAFVQTVRMQMISRHVGGSCYTTGDTLVGPRRELIVGSLVDQRSMLKHVENILANVSGLHPDRKDILREVQVIIRNPVPWRLVDAQKRASKECVND